MKLDEIRMSPDYAAGLKINRISLLVLCSMFRSVLHLIRYFHHELLESDLRKIKSCLLAFREHWSLGGKCPHWVEGRSEIHAYSFRPVLEGTG
jgi:hypothetical protein